MASPGARSRGPLVRAGVVLVVAAMALVAGCPRENNQEAERRGDSDGAAGPPPADAPALPPLTRSLMLVAAEGTDPAKLAEAVAILERRLRAAGIPGRAEVAGADRVKVLLADDPALLPRAGALLTAGGHLQFVALITPPILDEDAIARERARIEGAKDGDAYDPQTERFDALPCDDPQAGSAVVLIDARERVEGYYVERSEAERGDVGFQVSFDMTPEGKAAFRAFTGKLVGRQMGVALDGRVRMVFEVVSAIDGSGVMSSPKGFSEEEAKNLAALIVSGRLPIDLSLEAE